MEDLKEKLINVFEKFLQKSTIEELSREKVDAKVHDFGEKCKKKLDFILKSIPEGINCYVNFFKIKGYGIKVLESCKEGDGFVYIFPIKATCKTSFGNYNLKSKSFFSKKEKKYKEICDIYKNYGLNGAKDIDSDWDCSDWVGVYAEKFTYAISYGQILREITKEEYDGLVAKYLTALCKLDLQFLESQIKAEE